MTLRRRIVACRACPRLVAHCREVARTKRRAYRDQAYWGRPVPSFGARRPRLLVVGLAPGAHGANRTGRVFTGDRSGDWLYRALFEHGFANQPTAEHARDGLRLVDAAVSAACRCAPPANRPTTAELDRCRPFLREELSAYRRLRVILALGRIAFDAAKRAWAELERAPFEPRPAFAHGAESASGRVVLLASYHPSQQNTLTGRLTRPMFHRVFCRARTILDA